MGKAIKTDRTTGRGGKASVSRSQQPGRGEDLKHSGADEKLQNKLKQEDPGTGLGGDRKQRRV